MFVVSKFSILLVLKSKYLPEKLKTMWGISNSEANFWMLTTARMKTFSFEYFHLVYN